MVAFAMPQDLGTRHYSTPEDSIWRAVRVSDGQELFFSSDQPALNAGWSPDGRTIAYTTRNGRDQSDDGLYIAAALGTPGRMLVASWDGKGVSLTVAHES